jgi:elongation factor Ts
VKDLLKEMAEKLAVDVRIGRFARFQVGEGLTKRSDNLAAEVAKQLEQG